MVDGLSVWIRREMNKSVKVIIRRGGKEEGKKTEASVSR
jgi:hypothetical protein